MDKLTEKQQKALRYIEGWLEKDEALSQREIARHFGLAQNAINQTIRYLREKGYLADTKGHRTLRLSQAYLETKRRAAGIPIIGRVAAGTPILAEENIEGYVDLKEYFEPGSNKFVLKVTGDSMVEAGIMDGDLVVVEAASEIGNGQIGVVSVNNEATVKKVYIRRKQIILEPANKAGGYKTMKVKKDSAGVRIIGKVTGCIRKL